MNFSKPFQTIALGLLSYLVVRIITHMSFVHLANFELFDQNYNLRKFSFKAHLQKFIPANKFLFEFICQNEWEISHLNTFPGFCYWIFSNNKKTKCIFTKINTDEIWEITLRSFLFFFSKYSRRQSCWYR